MSDKDFLMLEEYKIIKEECKHYFDYAYRNMNMAIVFFSAAFVFGLSGEKEVTQLLLFLYIIPVCGYVFGLLYFYCYSALAKLGYSEVRLETKMQEKGLSAYTKRNKQYKVGYILSYGTSFMFFLLAPIVSIAIGKAYIWFDKSGNIIDYGHPIMELLIFKILPYGLYLVYLIFSILIFIEMKKVTKE